MPFSGPLEDRIAIRELYDAYADGANRGDREAWLGCFAEDALWKTHYFELTGHAAIGAKYDEIDAAASDTTFMTQICAIEVDGDTAACRAVCQERLVQKAGGNYCLTGLYLDDLVRIDGRWFFQRRDYRVKVEEFPQPPA